MAGAEHNSSNSDNSSTGDNGILTETRSEGNRRERKTSGSRIPVDLHNVGSLGRHAGGVTTGGVNNNNALSPSTETRQVDNIKCRSGT